GRGRRREGGRARRGPPGGLSCWRTWAQCPCLSRARHRGVHLFGDNPRVSALVGRTSERAALDAVLARLPDGGGDVVTIGGEPGIGKSRLLAELAEAATAAGYVVLGAAASEYEDDLPYGVWAEALDPHLHGLDERRLARLGLADFAGLAATRPLVVWLDDLHWADAASVDAVAALVRRPPDAPVLLALAAREGPRPA